MTTFLLHTYDLIKMCHDANYVDNSAHVAGLVMISGFHDLGVFYLFCLDSQCFLYIMNVSMNEKYLNS